MKKTACQMASANKKPGQVLGSFAHDGHGHFDHDVGVQSNADWVLANGLQRTGRHAHSSFFYSETSFGQRFSDVEVGDGTEQTAIYTSFLRNGNGHAAQFLALGLSSGQFSGGSFFQFS